MPAPGGRKGGIEDRVDQAAEILPVAIQPGPESQAT
jgi:hypothetical protein